MLEGENKRREKETNRENLKDSFTMKYLISLGGRNLYFLYLFRECVREIVRKCEKDNVITKEWETKGGERDKKTKKAILERQYQNIVINCLKGRN